LTTISLPNLTNLISLEIFGYCNSLTSTSFLPSTVTTLPSSTFISCTSLTTVNLPNVTNLADYCFYGCSALTTVNLPAATYIGYFCFGYSTSLTTIDLPSCTDLGGTPGDDSVFYAISGNTITLTVPSALMTIDGGNPDGDIQYLQANNTVTIVTV
jgi:hypothetical protein